MTTPTSTGLNLLILDATPGAAGKFIITPGENKCNRYVLRRHVSAMTALSEALASTQWDIIMVMGKIPFSIYRKGNTLCSPSQTAALLTSWWRKWRGKSVTRPLLLLRQKNWKEVEEWIDPLRRAGIPWISNPKKGFELSFLDYHGVTKEDTADASICS